MGCRKALDCRRNSHGLDARARHSGLHFEHRDADYPPRSTEILFGLAHSPRKKRGDSVRSRTQRRNNGEDILFGLAHSVGRSGGIFSAAHTRRNIDEEYFCSVSHTVPEERRDGPCSLSHIERTNASGDVFGRAHNAETSRCSRRSERHYWLGTRQPTLRAGAIRKRVACSIPTT